MNFNLLNLVQSGPAYDWFTFTWWAVVAVIIVGLVYFLPKLIKTEEKRLTTVKIFAIVGLLSHLSIFFVFLFRNGAVDAGAAMDAMFAIAPCNAMTWIAVLMFLFNKGKVQNKLFIIGAYGTLMFGLITLLYPDFYPGASDFNFGFMSNYGFWKSIIFHSIMIMTGSLMFAFKIVKPKMKDGLVMLIGLLVGFYTYGYGFTLLAESRGMSNSFLYVRDFPLKDIFSVQVAILMVAFVVTIIGLIVEAKTLKKEDRTITKLINKVKSIPFLKKQA